MIKINTSDISFYIETLGCPKNQVDSRKLKASMLQSGYRENYTNTDADIYILNSCSFIQEAQEETINVLYKAIQQRPLLQKIAIIGCFPQRFHQAIEQEISEVDFFIGTGKFSTIPELLASKFNYKIQNSDADQWLYDRNANTTSSNHFTYLRIAEGCSRQCSFCIIPQIRGSLKEYSVNEVKEQLRIQNILNNKNIISEVILVSQDTISQKIENLENIIAYLSSIDEIQWIRLQYIFPDKRVLKLLPLFGKYKKLVPYLDIPFQHLSPSILKAMNRPYDIKLFTDIIEEAKSINNKFEFRTSFIIGYPNETSKDIDYIYSFLEKYTIHKLALFRYSHEINTPAEKNHNDTVTNDTKIQRINEIRSKHLESRINYRESLLGTTETMMIDHIEKKDEYYNLTMRRAVDSPDIDEVVFVDQSHSQMFEQKPQKGSLYPVKIHTQMEYDYLGEIIL